MKRKYCILSIIISAALLAGCLGSFQIHPMQKHSKNKKCAISSPLRGNRK